MLERVWGSIIKYSGLNAVIGIYMYMYIKCLSLEVYMSESRIFANVQISLQVLKADPSAFHKSLA